MIVRAQGKRFVVIRQHDHGLISGTLASHWANRPTPFESTMIAIRDHDIGWERLDDTLRWNPKTDEPYSFIDLPWSERFAAYQEGVDKVEEADVNEPGENTFPWYREGIRYGEDILEPTWHGADAVQFAPNPFDKDFDLSIPARVIDREGNLLAFKRQGMRILGQFSSGGA